MVDDERLMLNFLIFLFRGGVYVSRQVSSSLTLLSNSHGQGLLLHDIIYTINTSVYYHHYIPQIKGEPTGNTAAK